MGNMIELETSDGAEIAAYLAQPATPAKGAVVVVQEIFGLNHQIRGVVDHYASLGYLTIAPAIMDRMSAGYVTDTYGPEAFGLAMDIMKGFNSDLALLDIDAAIRQVAGAGKVGITGFCLGGAMSWRAAHAGMGLSAASGYYGGGIQRYIDLAPSIPIEMHYGEKDQGIPLDQVEELRRRYPQADVYLYPGDHGFANEERLPTYDAACRDKAMARTAAFFARHLG